MNKLYWQTENYTQIPKTPPYKEAKVEFIKVFDRTIRISSIDNFYYDSDNGNLNINKRYVCCGVKAKQIYDYLLSIFEYKEF